MNQDLKDQLNLIFENTDNEATSPQPSDLIEAQYNSSHTSSRYSDNPAYDEDEVFRYMSETGIIDPSLAFEQLQGINPVQQPNNFNELKTTMQEFGQQYERPIAEEMTSRLRVQPATRKYWEK